MSGFPKHATWLTLVIAAHGCATPTDVVETDLHGVWSSAEVSVELSAEGGSVRYRCGLGSIDPGWEVTDDGAFTATGLHRFGGGPLPTSEHEAYGAEYDGRVSPGGFELTVEIPDAEVHIGPLFLTRGGPLVSEICG